MSDLETELPVELDPDEEEYLEMIQSWDDKKEAEANDIPEVYYRAPDLPAESQRRRNYRIDEQGCIVVKNPSAWWIPKIKITEEIDGTIYTIHL